MLNFVLGFLSGIFANQVFGMLTRLFQARFEVSIGNPIDKPDGRDTLWIVPVRFQLKGLKKILMEPVKERFIAKVKLDSSSPIWGKWLVGDINANTCLVNGPDVIPALLVSTFSGKVRLLDDLEPSLDNGLHYLELEIYRLWDNSLVTHKRFEIHIEDNDIKWTLGKSEVEGGKNHGRLLL
jgi:hypothetical protein